MDDQVKQDWTLILLIYLDWITETIDSEKVTDPGKSPVLKNKMSWHLYLHCPLILDVLIFLCCFTVLRLGTMVE